MAVEDELNISIELVLQLLLILSVHWRECQREAISWILSIPASLLPSAGAIDVLKFDWHAFLAWIAYPSLETSFRKFICLKLLENAKDSRMLLIFVALRVLASMAFYKRSQLADSRI